MSISGCTQIGLNYVLAKPHLMAGERGSSRNGLHQDDRRLVDLQPHRPLHPHRHPYIHGHSQAVSQKLTITNKCNAMINLFRNSLAISRTILCFIFVKVSYYREDGHEEDTPPSPAFK